MSQMSNKQRKKLKREEKKQRIQKAKQSAGAPAVEREKLHKGKVMASIIIVMALLGAAAIIIAYS